MWLQPLFEVAMTFIHISFCWYHIARCTPLLRTILLKTTARPLWVRVLLFIYVMIVCFPCSYCWYYCSLWFISLLLAFVESMSSTHRQLAGNLSWRINVPFVYNFQRVIAIKLNLKMNWTKTLSFLSFSLNLTFCHTKTLITL